MALIDDVKVVCDRLAPLGWGDLLKQVTHGGLDLTQGSAQELQSSLISNLESIDRTLPGFEDFSPLGNCGVVAGQPSESLLYHAFASPLVTRDDKGRPLQGFPSPAELEVLENFIFSLVSV